MIEKLPASYDAWRTATPYDDEIEHVKTCPRHEDNHDGEPAVCTCPTWQEIEADRAQARAESKEKL